MSVFTSLDIEDISTPFSIICHPPTLKKILYAVAKREEKNIS